MAVSAVALVKAASIPAVPPVTPLPLPPTHVPFTAKHPLKRLNPFAAVEVALAPESARYVPVIPPVKVVVAGEPKVAAPVVPLNASAAVVLVASAVEVAM